MIKINNNSIMEYPTKTEEIRNYDNTVLFKSQVFFMKLFECKYSMDIQMVSSK